MSLETCIPAKGYLSYSTGLPSAEIILVEAVFAEVRAYKVFRSDTPVDDRGISRPSEDCLGFSDFFGMMLLALPCGYLRRLQEEGSRLDEVQMRKTGEI